MILKLKFGQDFEAEVISKKLELTRPQRDQKFSIPGFPEREKEKCSILFHAGPGSRRLESMKNYYLSLKWPGIIVLLHPCMSISN